jgi:hypothetical protein
MERLFLTEEVVRTMSCCGGKRAQLRGGPIQGMGLGRKGAGLPTSGFQQASYFEYLGATEIVVLGPVTHKKYAFSGPGARVAVDVRDAVAVRSVPGLREIRRR